jgi:hypothetical protein
MAVSKHWLKVDTNKHEDLNLMFANHGKEDKIYPLRTKILSKRDSKSTKQRSITKDLCKKHVKTSKRIHVFKLLKSQ